MRPGVCRRSQANTSRGESERNVLTKAQSEITREATLSLGVMVGLQSDLMNEEIHLRESSCSHTLGKRVSGGPLAPLETEIGLDKGRNSAKSYPSIEVVPADSELHKHTARQGVGYVRTQGYVGALRHIPHRVTEVLRRNVSAAKFVAEVPVERNRRENEAECAVYKFLIWEEMSRAQTLSLQLVAQLRLDVDRLCFKSRACELNVLLSRGRACQG
jgi:hypothetical protein